MHHPRWLFESIVHVSVKARRPPPYLENRALKFWALRCKNSKNQPEMTDANLGAKIGLVGQVWQWLTEPDQKCL